jgi:hypothetical protein
MNGCLGLASDAISGMPTNRSSVSAMSTRLAFWYVLLMLTGPNRKRYCGFLATYSPIALHSSSSGWNERWCSTRMKLRPSSRAGVICSKN